MFAEDGALCVYVDMTLKNCCYGYNMFLIHLILLNLLFFQNLTLVTSNS